MKKLIKKLNSTKSVKAYALASKACLAYFTTASEAERSELRKAIILKGNEMMSKAQESRQKADTLIAEYLNA